MNVAFALAEEALSVGEVPVGCCFVYNDEVIAKGRNEVNVHKCAVEHAEMVAIRRLEKWCVTKDLSLDKVLPSSILFVTVEPCIMCASALRFSLPAHPSKIVYGARNERFGGCGSVYSLHTLPATRPPLVCQSGVDEARAVTLLKRFYQQENLNAPPDIRKVKSVTNHKTDS